MICSVGDRISFAQDGLAGTGCIVAVRHGCYDDYAVRLDQEYEVAHNCDGLVGRHEGWYVDFNNVIELLSTGPEPEMMEISVTDLNAVLCG